MATLASQECIFQCLISATGAALLLCFIMLACDNVSPRKMMVIFSMIACRAMPELASRQAPVMPMISHGGTVPSWRDNAEAQRRGTPGGMD